jgi:hypothetical protein
MKRYRDVVTGVEEFRVGWRRLDLRSNTAVLNDEYMNRWPVTEDGQSRKATGDGSEEVLKCMGYTGEEGEGACTMVDEVSGWIRPGSEWWVHNRGAEGPEARKAHSLPPATKTLARRRPGRHKRSLIHLCVKRTPHRRRHTEAGSCRHQTLATAEEQMEAPAHGTRGRPGAAGPHRTLEGVQANGKRYHRCDEQAHPPQGSTSAEGIDGPRTRG